MKFANGVGRRGALDHVLRHAAHQKKAEGKEAKEGGAKEGAKGLREDEVIRVETSPPKGAESQQRGREQNRSGLDQVDTDLKTQFRTLKTRMKRKLGTREKSASGRGRTRMENVKLGW